MRPILNRPSFRVLFLLLAVSLSGSALPEGARPRPLPANWGLRKAVPFETLRKNYLAYCDEYWWPSLQANGRVLKAHPELRAESLRWEILDVPGETEAQVPASFFAVALSEFRTYGRG